MNEPTDLRPAAGPRPGRSQATAWLVAAALALAAAAWWASHRGPVALAPVKQVTIAMPTQVNSTPLIVANAQGLFRQAGVDVLTQPFALGKDALASLVAGRADLAVVSDVPFLFALHAGGDLAVVASISQARRTLAIVARADRGIDDVKGLAGKTVGLILGTNFTYFLDAMLQVHGVDSAQVRLVDMRVDAAVAALKQGQIDAAVVFQPALAVLQAEMGERIKVFFGEDVYAFRYLLVGRPSYVDRHPQEVQRVLSALVAATDSIRARPAQARLAVGKVVQVDDAVMAKLFDPEDYIVSLDPGLLLALDDQTRWAMKRGLVRPGPVPNYLEAIRFAPLTAVSPAAVRVAH